MVPIFCLAIGAAMWALASGMIDTPEPRHICGSASMAPLVPAPAAAVPTPAVELQTVVADVAPFDSARESASVAQDKPFDSARESASVAQDKPGRVAS